MSSQSRIAEKLRVRLIEQRIRVYCIMIHSRYSTEAKQQKFLFFFFYYFGGEISKNIVHALRVLCVSNERLFSPRRPRLYDKNIHLSLSP